MMRWLPEWEYYPSVSVAAGYLRFTDNEVSYTIPGERVNVDIDQHGNVIGVEVFL